MPALDLLTQLLLVVLGFASRLLAARADARARRSGTSPTWHALAFALPLAMLAFTGLETVANLAAEARRPGVDLPRSVFGGIATVIDDVRRDRRRRRLGVPRRRTPSSAARWIRSPLLGVADRHPPRSCRTGSAHALRVLRRDHRRADPARRGDHVDLRLLAARLLARRARPAAASFGRLSRRAHVSPQAIVAAAVISSAIVIATSFLQARRHVPREPVLVRRPARVHRRAARGDQAPDHASPTWRGPTARRSASGSDRRTSRSPRSSARSGRSRSGSSRSRRTRPRATPARSGS